MRLYCFYDVISIIYDLFRGGNHEQCLHAWQDDLSLAVTHEDIVWF